LQRLGASAEAIAEGRVFVDRQRVWDAALRLAPGQELAVFARRDRAPEVHILAQRGGIIAVEKPAGISTEADHRGSEQSAQGQLARLLDVPVSQITALGRLDRPVSGVVLFAEDAAAREQAARARLAHAFRRRYTALSGGHPGADAGQWTGPIGKGRRPGLCAVGGRDAKPANTRFLVRSALGPAGPVLLQLEPGTGRTHQIRVHAAAAGAPLVGDADYGGLRHLAASDGSVQSVGRVALHATLVELPLDSGETFRVVSPPVAMLGALWNAVGGAPSDFEVLESAPWLS
jgi:23S rRNA-/tRNA-specific pseudouridylate synthase